METKTGEEILTVHTPPQPYPIYIGASLRTLLAQYLGRHCAPQNIIVSNETVAPLYLEHLQAALHACGAAVQTVILPDGEAYKTHETLMQIYTALLQKHIERDAVLFALGGGVIGDMAGFAAATYQRGIRFVQIPTTLLAQVDSSVGGKTGINHPLGKNMIGAFYQPQAVFAAQDVLRTLPEREFAAGMAEVVKYALLGDAAFLVWLEKNIDALNAHNAAALAYAVRHCCAMKAAIVAADEREKGSRALLNLGHTFGHAVETEMGYGNWLHGEAVAAGMVAAARLSAAMGFLENRDVVRIQTLLKRARLPEEPPVFAFAQWLAHMRHDKKVQNGQIRFVVLEQLGKAAVHACNDENLIRQALPGAL